MAFGAGYATEGFEVFPDWAAAAGAASSAFFRGRFQDAVADREKGLLLSEELLFTQSNARVLVGQSPQGSLRFMAMPIQVYPAPVMVKEHTPDGIGFDPGMHHQMDMLMYVGDLSYRLVLEGDETEIDPVAGGREDETVYGEHFLPVTRARHGEFEADIMSFAPVAEDPESAPLSPAPLPGPAGAFFVMRLRNRGAGPVRGKVVLRAKGLLVGHRNEIESPSELGGRAVSEVRQQTLILSRSFGCVGVHLHNGTWSQTEDGFRAERPVYLKPGEEITVETRLAAGTRYGDILKEIYRLYLRSGLDWLDRTAYFWRSRLGSLDLDAQGARQEALASRDLYIRFLLDNFNCIQTDAEGNVISLWQGAPSHQWEKIWGIDVEPTAVSVNQVCPELARQVLLFFLNRSRAPRRKYPDHSTAILVAPVIIARKWLEVSGDAEFLKERVEILDALKGILDEALSFRAKGKSLFSSRYSSDGRVERRYDFGTNVKVAYAFDSFAYILSAIGKDGKAASYRRVARETRAAMRRTMAGGGPFGPQIHGGVNLNENDDRFYLKDGIPYYDGEDSSSALAPVYGFCTLDDPVWINYHRFARSLWCHNYDPEFGALRWTAHWWPESALDGTAYVSRLGGSLTKEEMLESLKNMIEYDCGEQGSIYWWPLGRNAKRRLTRCSQGQGAWAWQYREQWLGLRVDSISKTLEIVPQGLLSRVDWEGFWAGGSRFDISWKETQSGTQLRLRNRNSETWRLRAGFRAPGSGAEGKVAWKTRPLDPGDEVSLFVSAPGVRTKSSGLRPFSDIVAGRIGDKDGIVFCPYGHPFIYGNPDSDVVAVRLYLLNGTKSDWNEVYVSLRVPDGWLIQARERGEFRTPDSLVQGEASVALGTVSSRGETVAPFWVKAPMEFDRSASIAAANRLLDTEGPARGKIQLVASAERESEEIVLEGAMSAKTPKGASIGRRIPVVLLISPAG